MKIAFLGTSEFAVPALQSLVDAGHDVAAVYTRAPKPAGRGQQERKTPVHVLADTLGLPARTPKTLKNDAEAEAFRTLDLDAAVVVSYGHILTKSFLDAPVLGCVNIHASLLPRWRGAAPIHRAILAGDARTGVTIMRVVLALDAGPAIARVAIDIDPDDTTDALEARLSAGGAELLMRAIGDVVSGQAAETPQDESLVTHAARVDRRDSPIDWSRPAP